MFTYTLQRKLRRYFCHGNESTLLVHLHIPLAANKSSKKDKLGYSGPKKEIIIEQFSHLIDKPLVLSAIDNWTD